MDKYFSEFEICPALECGACDVTIIDSHLMY